MPLGTIVEYSGDYFFVAVEGGEEVLVRRRGKVELIERERRHRAQEQRELEKLVSHKVAVGDQVQLSETDPGQYVIEHVLERETWLIRSSRGRYARRPQCVVANADQLAVVVAPNPVIRPSVIDRCFLAAIQGGLDPLLIINKIDLDPKLPQNVTLRNYRALGYRVFFTQATSGEGIAELANVLDGVSTAFCGHSGVGKSTILSAITGTEIRTAEVQEKTLKGRQTTTAARMYMLPGGGNVIDTPGIREFGLFHLTWLDVHDYFTDIAGYSVDCGFRDCTHSAEPDCRVQAAISAGELSPSRLDSYAKLRKEAEDFKAWK